MSYLVREYKVGHTANSDGEITAYFVTDCFDDAELKKGLRPHIAMFPVSQLYDRYEQENRADMYVNYLNKMQEAKQQIYEQTMLMDILKK